MHKIKISTLLKVLISVILIFYFYNTLNFNYLKQEFIKINVNFFILSLVIFLPNTSLFIYKWFLLTKNFSKIKFINLYKKLSSSILLAEILQNSIVIDVAKFAYLKKISSLTKLILIFNDKFITFSVKIFFSSSLVLMFLYYFDMHLIISIEYVLYLSIVILLFAVLIFFFKEKIKSYYKKYLSKEIIERKKIIFLEILRNSQIFLLYFFSFFSFFEIKTALTFAILSPVIETALRFQFLSSFGIREFIILALGNQFGLEQETILPSILITVVTLLTSFNNFLISRFCKITKSRQSDKEYDTVVYLHNNNTKGAVDFFSQLKIIKKQNNKISFLNHLPFNAKKILITENFANPLEFTKILFFLYFFKGKSYLLLTEFPTITKQFYSYNDFNKTITKGLILSLLDYIAFKFLNLIRIKIRNTNTSLTYFQLRFFTSKILSRFFDFAILAHPEIKYSHLGFKKNEVLLFPYYFKKINISNFEKKKYAFDFSGVLTSHRLSILNKINLSNQHVENKKIFQLTKNKMGKFISSKQYKNVINFSLHLEKEKKWPYSSPTRIVNSLSKNEIPISLKKFNDLYSSLYINYKDLIKIKKKPQLLKILKKLNNNIDKFSSGYDEKVKNLITL
jgi:hypothetical protein